MLTKIVGIVVLVAAIAVGGYVLWKSNVPEPEVIPPEPEPVVETTSTYSSSTLGYSVIYPKDYRVEESYAYDAFGEEKLIHGVKFLVPESFATGTNLSSFDTGVSIESLPRAKNCTGDIYLTADVRPTLLSEGGVAYSVASSSEGAAGNRYEEIVFALSSSSPCTAVRYFIHSTSVENYEPGTVKPYDRKALMEVFDAIRKSLTLVR